MGDTFTTSQVDNPVEFHSGPMNFSIQKSIPNKVDGTLKFSESYTPSAAIYRGKRPIVAKTVTTTDIPTSDVMEDFEGRNNVKPVTVRRDKVKIEFTIAPDTDLLGKVVGDLQEDTAVSGDNILGTSHYVTGYTGFSGDPEEQEGNYLAFKVAYADVHTKITVQGGNAPEVQVDPSDLTHVLIIKKPNPIVLRAYNGDVVVSTKTYNLSQLVLETEE